MRTQKKARALAGALLVGAMVWSMTTTAQAQPAEGETHSGTWYETAYATWTGSDDGYRAYVRSLEAYDWRDDTAIDGWLSDWTEVDAPLVREVDPHRSTWRVDVHGLPRGAYEIQVRAADGTTTVHTFDDLQTSTFPRNGAAFVPSNENPFQGNHGFALDGAVGGYLPDGRVDPAAEVVYVTHGDMAETLPADLFTADRGETANERTPLVVRFLGTVGAFDRVAATAEDAGAEVPPAAFRDNRMLTVGAGNGNVTFEGVGPDALVYGWGITTGGAHNVVFRNLTFDHYFEDALEIHGGGGDVRASNVWVHHNTFGYGQNRFLNIPDTDPDQAKGDGATDITNQARNYTVAYNHYAGSSKVLLIGGGAGSISPHYGTLHHNWFQGSEERTPRVRNGRVHVFNNVYQDIQGHPYHDVLLERNTGYGIGAGHNATIWAEGNVFDGVNFPFLRSRQGHARGHQVIDYEPGPDESASANAGFNHFFGDAPGFIVTREVVTDGDFPDAVEDFRDPADHQPGLTEEDLDLLRQAALSLQPNVLDAASQQNFYPDLDIGVTVAEGSTTTNPNMTANPPAQLDWSFRPSADGVWPTGDAGQVAALRAEIETFAGAMPAPVPSSVPRAPSITDVRVNDEVLSVGGSFIPEPKVVVHEGTFTVEWASDDVLAESYEIQWDAGTGDWETLATVPANARPTSFVTQEIDQFANLERILARSTDDEAVYRFRVRATNAAGAGDWSAVYPPADPTDPDPTDPTPGPSFSDVRPGHPFYTEIRWLADAGLAAGYPDGTFRPSTRLSRQAMAAFIHRYAGDPEWAPGSGVQTFSDVPASHPFHTEIEWLAAHGLAEGYGDGTFRPSTRMSRQAMAAFVFRLSAVEDYVPSGQPAFTDVTSGHPFFTEIQWMFDTGLSAGYQDGTFLGSRGISRQATAAFLARYDSAFG